MQLFPRSLNFLPLALAVGAGGAGAGVTGLIWYYFSPKNLQVGYAPEQPVPYSHKLHAGELGIDCRYCHANVERSQEAMVPPTETCMGCHAVVKKDSEKLAALRASWQSGEPMQWIRVHKLPDHVYFDHSVHLAVGVGCSSCHGRIDQMDVVRLDKPIAMGWCLECHRDPGPNLRPKDQITNMSWRPGEGGPELAKADVHPPEYCSGCHR
jgi:Cytochrome c7 and related cytochrome c/Class III cytochrome C family